MTTTEMLTTLTNGERQSYATRNGDTVVECRGDVMGTTLYHVTSRNPFHGGAWTYDDVTSIEDLLTRSLRADDTVQWKRV